MQTLPTEPNEKHPSNLILPKIVTNSIVWSPKKQSPTNFRHSHRNLYKTMSLSQTKPMHQKLNLYKNKNIEFLQKLNLEIGVNEIYEDQVYQEKQKEKVNTNSEIKQKRLGTYKKEDEENKKDNYQSIEISLENDLYMKKVDTKEKEKITEKKFKQALVELRKIEDDIYNTNCNIKNIYDKIEENKLEINALNTRYLLEKDKNTTREYDSQREKSKNEKYEQFEQYNKFAAMKYQNEEKQKLIQNNIENLKNELSIFENTQSDLRIKCKNIKHKIYILRKELVNMYHLKLYEGLDFHNDGLTSIIRSIWNLGVNVDINFMPTYLDTQSIDYLFTKAKKLIEVSKMKQYIDDAQADLIKSIQMWKDELTGNKSMDEKNNNNFFETRLKNNGRTLNDNSFLDGYPKSKEFMNNYKKKHKQDFEINEKVSVTKSNFVCRNVPIIIFEKKKKIDKIKFLLQELLDEVNKNEIKVLKRLVKEFTDNNYEEKYGVTPEVIIAALFGEEHKDDRINAFTRMQREYKDNMKKVEFHSSFIRPIKK